MIAMRFLFFNTCCICFLFACQSKKTIEEGALVSDTLVPQEEVVDTTPVTKLTEIHDTDFVDLSYYTDQIAYDFRYADTNNFIHEKVYPCVQCLLRKEVALALVQANASLLPKGYRLRLFDCYRPLSVQHKMWKIFPDGRYVANPHTSGSIHNRGGAVDVTLELLEGSVVDMGTDFDHFGKEAHTSYTSFKQEIIAHRKLLQDAMIAAGFAPLKTEWWHFNFGESKKYSISNVPFDCDK